MHDNKSYISSFCRIKNNHVTLNGDTVFSKEGTYSEFIKSAYKNLDIKYPKFFKMDRLSKLAFIAANVVLNHENVTPEQEENIAIVFSNKASSLDSDRTHQTSIQNKENYYPSPAVFVYTLPNICIGEISIKYKLYSENSFFIFDNFNAKHLLTYANNLLDTKKADKVLCGWVEYDGNNYDALLYLVGNKGKTEHNTTEINTLYNS
ncbi:3-oxoacyl-ACP synthase [Mangrovimonas spongiae]|uniref:3-oxoacyl-ACP synthase n=1 Tax=Mangrovimonas spongiae TaxID=2494697 RepID=A0A3R9P047_9FLAO|nr:3-oxoacyl-ACP synthase [Mangrovimonas spongiae]RSK41382.1 3-oxoacyl-ACP synthase [Mangrovimonas spongiae]